MTTTTGLSQPGHSVPTKSSEALRLRSLGLSNKQGAAVLGVPVDSFRRLVSEGNRHQSNHTPPEIRASPDATFVPQHGPHYGNLLESLRPPRSLEAQRWAEVLGKRAVGPAKKPTKHIFIPDPQCGPGDDLSMLEWAGRYVAEQEPDTVINAGDMWHFDSLSMYEGKGTKFHEGRRYRADVDAGNKGMHLFEDGLARDSRPGYKPRKVLLRGNHEDRLTRAINADPRLEGAIGFQDLEDVSLGWEVHDFLEPVMIDGLTYSHFFVNPANGRPYTGNVDTMLRNVGFSFVQGHSQGLRWGRRELTNGVVQIGLVAGSFYLKDEVYRGPQAKSEWRGLCVLHEVRDGQYDPMFVSLDYLQRRYG